MSLHPAILHCQYAYIRDNHMGLHPAILHFQYAEICVKNMGLEAAIPHCQYAEIFFKLQRFGHSQFLLSICRNQYSL